MAFDRLALRCDGPVKESQARVADPGVVQRVRVDRRITQILERQRPLEPRQRGVVPLLNELAVTEVEQRDGLVITIAPWTWRSQYARSARLALFPLTELELGDACVHVDVEPQVVGKRTCRRQFLAPLEVSVAALPIAFEQLIEARQKLPPGAHEIEVGSVRRFGGRAGGGLGQFVFS